MRVVIFTLLGCLAVAGYGAAGSAAADRGKASASQGKPFATRLDRSHAGTPAPKAAFTMRDGASATIGDFRGKPVLVNLWATWCAPCIAELPDLDEFATARAKTLSVVAISQDLGGWRAVDKFWVTGKFETLVARLDAPGNYAQAVGAAGLPVSILYDAQGRERWRVNGPVKWQTPEVAAALK